MDETSVKREPSSKTKRSKTDHVKNIVQAYMQKRNYGSINYLENTKIQDQITYSTIETEVSQTNSILFSCHNNNPTAIDQNFAKFAAWIKDLTKNKNICHDLELLVAPLFCHLYLEILKGGNTDRASTFFKSHLATIDRTKCDSFVKDLINSITGDADAKHLEEQFRSNKYSLELSQQSIKNLQKFVVDNCHIVFLQVLRTWFDLQEITEEDKAAINEKMEDVLAKTHQSNGGVHSDDKFKKMLEAIEEVNNEPKPIFTLSISCAKELVNCALIDRKCGLVAYNQLNQVHLRPINSFDNILGHNCKEIQLSDHVEQVTAIALAPDFRTIVTGALDSIICIYSLETMTLLRKSRGHIKAINCLAIASNNNYIASGSHDHTARLWFIEDGRLLRIFVGHTQAITCLDFHPNCLYLATGSVDKSIRMWSVDNGNPLRLFHESKGVIYGIAFNPQGGTIAACGDDKKLRIWDVLTCKVLNEFKCKGDLLVKAKWNASGSEVCCGALNGTLRVWSVNDRNNESGSLSQDKNYEPLQTTVVNGKILGLEYAFDTFACVST